MRISDWSSDVCSSDLGLGRPRGHAGLHGHRSGRTRRGARMSLAVLEITDLHAWYGESHVLHGVNLTVAQGEVVTLLGRNGSGRTTTLRAMLGLPGARKGALRLGGPESIALPPYKTTHPV